MEAEEAPPDDQSDEEMQTCDEYLDGSICRVRLHNFLTYRDAEFSPGPRLNLVLGPNGTGKSSIVCALCVGLAGSTKLLGRADKVGQFVRHEQEWGFTEIELFFARGNRVIKRMIYRDNRSTWSVDGRASTLKEVTELMMTAHIQIDNLCQFLPQDKVGEFARMNASQLLRATENAIGNGELAKTHDEIIELQTGMKDKEREFENARDSLELKRTENAQRKKEVDRLKEHQSLLEETKLMEKKCFWLEFEAAKRVVEQLKEHKKLCKMKMEKAQQHKVVPLEQMLEKSRLQLEEAQAQVAETIKLKQILENKLKNQKESLEKLDGDQRTTREEMDALKSHHRQNQQRLERAEGALEDLKRQRERLPDREELHSQKSALEEKIVAQENDFRSLLNERSALTRQMHESENSIVQIKSRIAKLDNEQLQRRRRFERFDADAMRAADWIQKNRTKFRRKVWGPLAMELSVSSLLDAKYVEAILPKHVKSAFVTECYDDYNTLLQELCNHPNLAQRIKTTVINVENGESKPFTRPFSHQQMEDFRQRYGITGYLDALVKAPQVIHEALRSNCGLHTVLVGTDQTEDVVNSGADLFSELGRTDIGKGVFLTPLKRYMISVSKYGNRNATTQALDLKISRLLAPSSANEQEKQRLVEQLHDAQRELHEVQQRIEQVKNRERAHGNAKLELNNRIRSIRDQLRSIVQLEDKIQVMEDKVQNLRDELARNVEEKENALNRKLKNQTIKMCKQLNDYVDLTKEILANTIHDSVLTMNRTASHVRVETIERRLFQARRAIDSLQVAYCSAKDRLKSKAKYAMTLKRTAEQEAPLCKYEQAFADLSDDLDTLRANIQNNKASMDCFRGDFSIREVYERMCQEIEEEEARLKELEDFVTNGEDKIKAIKDSWHQKLREVVAQIDTSFKEYFQDIGCVGEIVLDDDHTDISRWGIERRAQFRKNAKLSTMTAEEQSGGEKSVGTIMYLMALQSLTQCPFRVVDEINQGMDVYNERKVFQRITKAACGAKLPQYFLITPKLITGLAYHRDTKVLIIFNGPLNRVAQKKWDMQQFIEACRPTNHKRHSESTPNGFRPKRAKREIVG